LPTGGGGAGGGAALGAERGGIADTVGFPVLLLFDELFEGPHIATHSAMPARMTAPIANRISRGLTEVIGIDVSPIVRFRLSEYPPERRYQPP
jgi:hypothetical protein